MATHLLIKEHIQELKNLKIKKLPIPDSSGLHPDHDWVCNEYMSWAKRFADFSPNLQTLPKFTVMYLKEGPKQRLLSYIKVMDNAFNIDMYLPAIKMERSSQKMEELVKKFLHTLNTGEAEEGFVMGQRYLESIEQFKKEAAPQQLTLAKQIIERGFKAHLKVHCDYWMKNKVIPLQDYIPLRLNESFWRLNILLCEYSIGYSVPERVRQNELVKLLTRKIAEWLLAVDDYYMSLLKILANDQMTRVISYIDEKKCTVNEAFEDQYKYTMDLYEECNQLIAKINANPELASTQFNKYISLAMNIGPALYRLFDGHLSFKLDEDMTISSAKCHQMLDNWINKNYSHDCWHIE